MRPNLAFAALTSLALTAGCAPADDACSCDIIGADSICVELAAPDDPLYAQQLQGSCTNVLESLCTSLAGAYTYGVACPRTDVIATCEVGAVSYIQTKVWYSTGGDPIDPAGTDPEDDCASNGTVTRF